MSTLSNNDIAQAIYLFLKDKKDFELGENKKVVDFLSRRRLLSKSSDILDKLDKIINKEKGKTVVKVISKERLRDKLRQELLIFLKEKYNAREIIIKEVIDKKLIGGVRLEVNNEVIDLSIKNKIKKLQEHLIRKI